MKQTLETFIEKVKAKHGDLYDFSNSTYEGLDKPITYICPEHGEVTQIAKKVLVRSGCSQCDIEKAKKKRRSGGYSKRKGNSYESKIVKELTELGYKGLKSSRSESKNLDDNKIDIAETEDKLPCYFQLKCTRNTPNYFKIAQECGTKDRPFCLIWNRQDSIEGQVNMCSVGELVMVPKDFFYELLKHYKN